jgi:hypothetical protein
LGDVIGDGDPYRWDIDHLAADVAHDVGVREV